MPKKRELYAVDGPLANKAIQVVEKRLGQEEEAARKANDWRTNDRLHSAAVRRKIIDTINQEIQTKRKASHRSLFISYSKDERIRADVIRRIAEEDFKFDLVRSGFDPDVQRRQHLRTGIVREIAEADCFLGIWSDDSQVSFGADDHSRNNGAPRVWMPIELGIACALDKPFRLLFHESIHKDYLMPVQDLPHFPYTDENFERQGREALLALHTRLAEITTSVGT